MKFIFLDHRRFRQGWTLLLIAGALVCMFPPRPPIFQWWAIHAGAVALGYLALGLIFLTLNKSRLMLVCFGCSAAISFFYYETNQGANTSSTRTETSLPHFSAASSAHIVELPVHENS